MLLRRGVVYHLSYIAVIGFPLGRKMALCTDPQLLWKSASITPASKGHLSPVHFITNVVQCSDSAVRAPDLYAWWSVHPHSCACVLHYRDRIVCEMAAAPKGSAPGPVKLCVGECRPELRAQSSQLYSFVVILSFNHINFVHLARNKHQVFAMN